MNNIFRHEKLIRAGLSLVLAIIATHYHQWWLLLFSLTLMLTSVYHFCPVYSFFGINSKQAKKRLYLSRLPEHSPVATLIFDQHGKLKFSNTTAQKTFPAIDDLQGLDNQSDFIKNIQQQKHVINEYRHEHHDYLIHYIYDEQIESILTYALDVTDLVQANNEVIDTQKELVYRLGEIGETRSKETGNHVKRVAQYSYLLAKLAGIDEDTAQLLKTASPLHDIGKIAIPDDVLLKPGKLNEQEWVVMKTHASIGENLLGNSERPIFKAAAIISGQHHEKWNGAGYPKGLQGKDIHVFGRITAVVDVFDALGSDRVYKKSWPMEKILKLFKEESGQHFDPNLVSLFLDNLEQFEVIRAKYQEKLS